MKKSRILAIAALLLATTFADAQQMPPGKWWRREEVVRQLELTRDQQEKLDAVFRGAADELIDAKAAVDKLQIALRSELDRPQVRRQELQRIAGQLSQARGKLFEREVLMLADMRVVLEEDQWARLRQFLDRIQERMPRHPEERPQRPAPRRRP
jgi:Skp family chaperone for outer membrane proteins